MELKIKDSEFFQDAMGITVENANDYFEYFAKLIKTTKNRSETVKQMWKRMQTDEEFTRIVMSVVMFATVERLTKGLKKLKNNVTIN